LLVPLLERELGSEGHHWVLLDRDLLTHALTHHRLPERLAAFLPEDRISETKAVIGELVGLHPSLWALEHKIAEAVLQLAHVGHVIFVGRAANLITRGVPGGLHIRLVAPLEVRVERNDLARRRYVRTHFQQDIDNPCLYDLVINTARFSPEATTQLVAEALQDRLHS
jgi:cytidylate kinase